MLHPSGNRMLNRISAIAGNSTMQLMPGLFNLGLSLVVIRYFNKEWWGEIATLQLFQYLLVNLLTWGNKDYLLREFSIRPNSIRELWLNSFLGRSALLVIPLIVIPFLNYPSYSLFHLMLWIFLKFIQQSFEAPILFHRKFSIVILNETIAFLLLLLLFVIPFDEFSFNQLLSFITLVNLIKTIFLILFGPEKINWLLFNSGKAVRMLKNSIPFMLLSFSGILNAKSDFLCVVYFLNKGDIASYQVLAGFTTFFQAIPMLVTAPFLKNIYRSKPEFVSSLQRKSVLNGFLLCSAGMPVLFLILNNIFRLHYSPLTWLFTYAFILLSFTYFLYVYVLFRIEKQNTVMVISFLSVAMNAGLCFLMVPQLGLTGAMLANAITQALLWATYRSLYRKSNKILLS